MNIGYYVISILFYFSQLIRNLWYIHDVFCIYFVKSTELTWDLRL